MSHDLHLIGVRKALKPRREPYWGAPLAEGRYVGFRKIDEQTGTWIGRLRDDDGRQNYRALGQVTSKFEYAQAKDAAEAWFTAFDVGVSADAPTVADVCREYVAELEAESRIKAARHSRKRFERHVYNAPLAKVRMDRLRSSHIKTWRQGMGTGKATQNRDMTALRAALNLAVQNRRVNAAVAIEWGAVKQHRGADRRRDIYLDLKQRRALIGKCKGALRDLVEAAAVTGARPGELVSMPRSAFDARTGTATFSGKTGTRTVPIATAAVELFKRLAKGKLPNAPLLPRDDGKPFDRWALAVKDAVKAAKLPHAVVLYTLRHSWITEALRSGMSTLDVARLTGTSLQMIESNYGHLVADSARERLALVTML